jgi:hypothetical protein
MSTVMRFINCTAFPRRGYAKLQNTTVLTTRVRLVAFDCVFVKEGQSMQVDLGIRRCACKLYANYGLLLFHWHQRCVCTRAHSSIYVDSHVVEKRQLELFVGGGQPDYKVPHHRVRSTTVAVSSARQFTSHLLLVSCYFPFPVTFINLRLQWPVDSGLIDQPRDHPGR